jgi:branched-chain amino acid transport system permease protein
VQFIFAGLVLGAIYAVAASGLVITYTATGVLNLAFGSQAYFVARLYYYLHTQHGWSIVTAAVVSVFLVGPSLGLFLYVVLFQFLRTSSSLIKVVTTVGLSVCLPPIAVMLFHNTQITSAPGLAPTPVRIFHVFGVGVSLDQVIVLICTIAIAVIGSVVIKFTSAGMAMRAMVDSPALTSASGTSPTRVSIVVWAVATTLAGLTGVLVAPTIGLDSPNAFTLLLTSALAAVIVAELRSLTRAVLVGLLLGVLGGVVEWAVPSSSLWSSAASTSIPFIVTVLFVLYQAVRGTAREGGASGGPLDRALEHVQHEIGRISAPSRRRHGLPALYQRFEGGTLLSLALIAILPMVLHNYWIGLTGLGLAYGVVLLSYTLVTGEGGLISLCQVTFAGSGAVATGQLISVWHWPAILALAVGGLIIAPLGLIVGLVSTWMGELHLALITLTFGVLMDNLVFTLNRFTQYGTGIVITRPSFANGDLSFTYLVLATFVVLALIVYNVRRSTTGLGVAAVRWSRDGAQTIGISAIQMNVTVTTIGAFVAAIGGGLISLYNYNANPSTFPTLLGLVWLAVVVTIGIRSIPGAAVAGLTLAFVPALFARYLPLSWAQLPTALFGLGAVLAARNPGGVIAMHAGQLARLATRLASRAVTPPMSAATGHSEVAPVPQYSARSEEA